MFECYMTSRHKSDRYPIIVMDLESTNIVKSKFKIIKKKRNDHACFSMY